MPVPERRPRTRHHSVEAFMTRESWRGEWWAAALRLGICSVSALRLIVLEWGLLITGDPSLLVPLLGLLTGILVSAISLTRWRADRIEFRLAMYASVTFDALLLLWIMLPRVVWPNHHYDGVTHTTEFLAFALVIVGAGLRLSRRIALYGTSLNIAIVMGLIALDHALNAHLLHYTITQATLSFILLLGAGALSYGVAHRTNRLVDEGSQYVQMMGAYISPEFLDLVMDKGGGLYPDVAVLFSDLRGFTTYAQGIQPGQLITELNQYLEAMAVAINLERGIVDKYIGDSIMVVYGVPDSKGDEAMRAIRTAWRMERALTELNQRRQTAGLEPLRQGIGVHHGPVIAGVIGTETKLQFTVVGDTVNVASRLEGLSKELGSAIVLSKNVVEAAGLLDEAARTEAGTPPVAQLGTAKIRGWIGEQVVYTILPTEEIPSLTLPERRQIGPA